MKAFLESTQYVNWLNECIMQKAKELFIGAKSDIEKARIAFEFVRDEIPHTFDIQKDMIVATASDVLKMGTGICHAKANLLAALLRTQAIPVGFCYQYITLGNTDELGYCLHCYNAIWLNQKWIKVDARGNTNGINAQFSLDEPKLAFPIRKEYNEHFIKGIYATPHMETMEMLENCSTIQDVMENIPCERVDSPNVI